MVCICMYCRYVDEYVVGNNKGGCTEKKKRKTGGARKLARKNVKSTTVGVTSFVSTEIEIRRLLLLRVITSFWILYF